MVLQPDRKILVVGTASDHFALARYTSSPPGTTRPTLTLTLDSAEPVPESVGTVDLTATLSEPAGDKGLRVTLVSKQSSTANTDDFVFPSPFLIPAGQTVATVEIEITDDDRVEPEEQLEIGASAGIASVNETLLKISDNDMAGVTISKSEISVAANLTETYTVKLTSEPSASVVVTPTSGTTAAATVSPAKLTFAPHNADRPQTVTVSGVAEGNSTITHAAESTDSDYNEIDIDSVTVTVGKPKPTTLTLSLADSSVLESIGTATVTATLNNPALSDTTVTFSAASGTATLATDFTVPATFTTAIAKGQKSGTADITITDDKIDENNETFTLSATGGGLTAPNVTVTIEDDDPAGVTVTPVSLTVDEGAEKTYTVKLINPPTENVTITPTSGSPTIATVSPTARTFNTTNWSTAQTFTVSGETVGTATITHATASSDSDYSGISVDSVAVTVEKPPPTSLEVRLANIRVPESTGSVTATASFDNPVKSATTVTFTAAGGTATKGTDYTVPATFTTTVAKGSSNGAATFNVTEDFIVEADETFMLRASGAGLAAAAVTVTIVDNDKAEVTVEPTTLDVDRGSTATYTARLRSKPAANVVVTASSGATSKARVSPATRTFTATNWNVKQTFTVTGVAIGTATIAHSAASTGDSDYNQISVDSVDVTVRYPAPTSLSIELGSLTVAENVGDVELTARFNRPVDSATTVTFFARNRTARQNADFTVPATFTATVARGQSTGSATVRITDDKIDEPNETFVVFANAEGVTAAPPKTVTITDNDTAGVTVSPDELTVREGATATYTVKLESQPVSVVTVDARSSAASKATVAPRARTFTTSNWNTAQTFTVTGVAEGTLSITHASRSGDTNYSDGEPDPVKVTVQKNPPTTLNVSLANRMVGEDAGSVTVTA
ncbi:MAG: hypothetical protein OXB92_17080, partial [Acidimicrobiaceae bacterium]|nr:hypothetical protein [Acidimicrobiaceae bacterium]